jgi:predicted dehydrogenase
MKILVVGVGSIGQRHARILHGLGHEVVPCDSNPALVEEVCQSLDIAERHLDYREAVSRGFDAVIVCTPNHLHAPVALAAFEHGSHVLVEKPIAHTLNDARAIIESAEAAGRVLLVGYVLRQWPGVRTLLEWMREERIGSVYAARVMLGAPETLVFARSDYRQRTGTGSGVIFDYSHELDYLRLLLGEVSSVACLTKILPNLLLRTEGMAAMLLQFQRGAIGQLHLDYVRPSCRVLELYGADGMITYDFGSAQLFCRLWNGQTEERTWPVERDQAFIQQFAAFSDLIAGRAVPPEHYAEGSDALKTLAVAVAALRSAEEMCFVEP